MRAGLDTTPTPAAIEELGFYICDVDLEDELIRSLGVEAPRPLDGVLEHVSESGRPVL